MNKQHQELLNFVAARHNRIAMQRALAKAPVPTAPQLKPLTPNQLDALMQRRLEEESTRQLRVLKVFYSVKRKRLPIPDKFSHAKTEDE